MCMLITVGVASCGHVCKTLKIIGCMCDASLCVMVKMYNYELYISIHVCTRYEF